MLPFFLFTADGTATYHSLRPFCAAFLPPHPWTVFPTPLIMLIPDAVPTTPTASYFLLFFSLLLWCLLTPNAFAQNHFADCQADTGSKASIVFPDTVPSPLSPGDEVAALMPDGRCAGALVWTGKAAVLTVWGDNVVTEAVDGFQAGEPLAFSAFDGVEERLFEVTYDLSSPVKQADVFTPRGLYVIESSQWEAPTLEVVFPNGGETLQPGSLQTIIWSGHSTGNVRVVLRRNNTYLTTINNNTKNDGLYEWRIPEDLAGEGYKIGIVSKDDKELYDLSDAPFTITHFFPAPILYKVAGKGGEPDRQDRLHWAPIMEATGYRLQISTSPDFTALAVDRLLDTKARAFTGETLAPGLYHIRVQALREEAAGEWAVTTLEVAAEVPETFLLAQNYPNPFNPTTHIRFALPEAGHVRLTVYDLLGREVAVLLNERRTAGYYEVAWEARGRAGEALSSGVYVYVITAGGERRIRRMVLLE